MPRSIPLARKCAARSAFSSLRKCWHPPSNAPHNTRFCTTPLGYQRDGFFSVIAAIVVIFFLCLVTFLPLLDFLPLSAFSYAVCHIYCLLALCNPTCERDLRHFLELPVGLYISVTYIQDIITHPLYIHLEPLNFGQIVIYNGVITVIYIYIYTLGKGDHDTHLQSRHNNLPLVVVIHVWLFVPLFFLQRQCATRHDVVTSRTQHGGGLFQSKQTYHHHTVVLILDSLRLRRSVAGTSVSKSGVAV